MGMGNWAQTPVINGGYAMLCLHLFRGEKLTPVKLHVFSAIYRGF